MGGAAAFSQHPYQYHLSPEDRRLLSRPRTTRSSELLRVARQADDIREVVENRWTELPEDIRSELTNLAYVIVEPPNTLRRRASLVFARASMAFLILREGPEALYTYHAAVRKLVRAILTAVERGQPEYQEALASSLDGEARELSDQEFGDWLDGVSTPAE